jgi:V/A-type H+-transporting ATPase subunit F
VSRKILVIADPEMAEGFRLSGAEVAEAKDPAEAAATLGKAIAAGGFGLIVVDGAAMDAMPSQDRERLDHLDQTLVIPIPMRESMAWRVTDRTDYLAGLIRATIGYHVRLSD